MIARFIDKHPEFLYVPATQVLMEARETGAIPYDLLGVELTHEGELCSFDIFLRKYQLVDPALKTLANIVRAADTDRLSLSPQAPGLLAITLGLSGVERIEIGDFHPDGGVLEDEICGNHLYSIWNPMSEIVINPLIPCASSAYKKLNTAL